MVEGRPCLETLVSKLPDILEHFQIAGGPFRWAELDSFDDRNLRVTLEGGTYVVKAHNGLLPSGSLERLQAQDQLITRLREQGLPVPDVLRSWENCSTFQLEAPLSRGLCLVRVLSYLEGVTIKNDTPKSPQFLRALGALCGRTQLALDGFDAEGFHWTWDWDMKCVPQVVRSKLHHLTSERRNLAQRLCDGYAEALSEERVSKLPHSVLHADLNDTNLLFESDGSDAPALAGILDFGDSIYSCRIFEPAIAAGYFSLCQADPVMVLQEVLRGYLEKVPWEIAEDEVLAYFHAARGRILLSVAFAAENSQLEPDNEYLAHTSEPGWAVLMALDNDLAIQGLHEVAREVAGKKVIGCRWNGK
ncbi:unnamed protein product [Cladocopium goreaui]|uniref:Hydroxylysine kinase n=1 Tax=Cladocopium goreaui TaxID=2562237 RepID=A0A9P1FPZ3_9DINO|nr:unnamed protein product [Cladocopium goreaui]